jgi:hypothetical protein
VLNDTLAHHVWTSEQGGSSFSRVIFLGTANGTALNDACLARKGDTEVIVGYACTVNIIPADANGFGIL